LGKTRTLTGDGVLKMKKNRWIFRLILIGAFGVLLICAILGVYLFRFHDALSSDHELFAAFGDYVGGTAGPVLSFLALIAILITIHVQLEELHESREQLRKSAEALEAQRAAMQDQLFDSAYFEQLRLLNDIINAMRLFARQSNERAGRACFVYFEQKLHEQYQQARGKGYASAYLIVYRAYEAHLGHYFRTLYNIVRFVDEKGPDKRLFYVRLLRAQLSDSELAIIFYNGLSEDGKNFKPLIEKYALLDNLKNSHILYPNHRAEYNDSAFSTDIAFAGSFATS